jgi:hypothetical protein
LTGVAYFLKNKQYDALVVGMSKYKSMSELIDSSSSFSTPFAL